MSEYLLARYRPIADALLEKHSLHVDDATSHALTTAIMHSRVLPATEKGTQAHSPVSAAAKALTHARKLLEYAATPPKRKDSISKRCRSLHAALLGNSPLALGLGVRMEGIANRPDYGQLLDNLEAGSVDVAALSVLIEPLNAIVAESHGWQRVGRPWGLGKRIVRMGCIVWRRSGNARLNYQWNDDSGKLIGRMPNFLRDLIACCNGRFSAIAELERQRNQIPPAGYATSRPIPQGNRLRLSDASLKAAVVACSQDVELQRFLSRVQKQRTYLT